MANHEPRDKTVGSGATPDRILSILAVLISLVALGLTGFQSWLIYDHNRISVEPLLDWRFTWNQEQILFRAKLINAGLGPAIISDASFSVDGARGLRLGPEACEELDRYLGVNANEHSLLHCWTMDEDEDFYLDTDETILVYQIGQPKSGDKLQILYEGLQPLGLYVKYCSFYGVCKTLE